MARFSFRRKRLSFSEMTNRVPAAVDPLDFLVGGRTASRDAFQQIHGAIHGTLGEVERSIGSMFERLRPDGNLSDRMVLEANAELRTELARANTFADVKRDEMLITIGSRLESLFIQRLVVAPEEEPPVRRWAALGDRAIRRDLPVVSEPNHRSLDVSPNDRKKRLTRWQAETDEYLETVCLNHVGEVINGLLEELNEYSASWVELVVDLRRLATSGGHLYQEVTDAEHWTFDSDDPTVKNLLTGGQAQDIAMRILSRFQLSNQDLSDIAQVSTIPWPESRSTGPTGSILWNCKTSWREPPRKRFRARCPSIPGSYPSWPMAPGLAKNWVSFLWTCTWAHPPWKRRCGAWEMSASVTLTLPQALVSPLPTSTTRSSEA